MNPVLLNDVAYADKLVSVEANILEKYLECQHAIEYYKGSYHQISKQSGIPYTTLLTYAKYGKHYRAPTAKKLVILRELIDNDFVSWERMLKVLYPPTRRVPSDPKKVVAALISQEIRPNLRPGWQIHTEYGRGLWLDYLL